MRALEGFRRMMDSYGVVRYRAVATSAVREAVNRDTFIDRVRLRTGIDVEVIDGSEENRLTYVAVRDALTEHEALNTADAILVEVGGGSADISFLRRGEPYAYSGTYALGAIRMRQNLAAWHGSHDQRVRLFQRTVQNIVEDIRREMPLREARHFLALGGDARFTADQLVGEDPALATRGVPRDRFLSFCEQTVALDDEQLGRGLPAGAAAPRSRRWGRRSSCTSEPPPRDPGRATVLVPEATLRAGLLLDMVRAGRGPRDRGLLAAGAGLGRGARREVPPRRPSRAARWPASPCACSTNCAPSTASRPATGCSSRWPRCSTTSASS